MKHAIKIVLHLISLTAIAVLVFFTNVVDRISLFKKSSKDDSDDNNLLKAKKANADIPAGSDSGYDDGSGSYSGGPVNGSGDDDCDEGGGGDEGDC